MKPTEWLIGQMLWLGLLLSMLIVLVGGTLYLIQNGSSLVHYQVFKGHHNNFHTYSGIINAARAFSAVGIIQLGLLILVFTQVLRVALTVWLFIKEKDYPFIGISLFILGILIYSLFWRG